MTIIGIIRHIDDLGRITLPSEIRKTYQLEKNDVVEIVGTADGILLRIPEITVVRKEKPAVDTVEELLK